MDDDDFLAAVEADNAHEPVEEPAIEAEAPLELTEEAQPEPQQVTPAPEPVAQPEAKPEPQQVPISVMLDERDKRKAADERAARLEAEIAEFRAQQQPQANPDIWEDPDGYQATQDQKLYQQNLRWSERIASIQHGAETVAEAKEWGINRCNTDRYFNAKVAGSDDPVGFVVSEWKREQIASQVTPDDFAQFQAWKQAQAQIQTPAPSSAAADPTPPRSVPPRSLASAPSAGGVMSEVVQSDDEIFEETFSRKK